MAQLGTVSVRRPAHFSPAAVDRLAAQFRTATDLDSAADLLPAVHRDYTEALHKPRELRTLVLDRIAHGAADASRILEWLGQLIDKAEFSKRTSSSGGETLAAVVDELVRVELCRGYVERVLLVEKLVGNLEDAVAGIAMGFAEQRFKIGGVRGDSGENLLEALNRLQSVAEMVSQFGPEAGQLVRAVELRIDRAASTIRSATVAEFKSFLQSMDWPPPLTLGDREFRDDSQRSNPLLEASDSTLSSCECSLCTFKLYFRVLSVLQALQQKRALERLNKDFSNRREKIRDPAANTSLVYEPLWAMEELVGPFASQAVYHFKKWVQKPELVCALAHSMCQEFVDTVDVLLQPVISDAGLTGYNAKEEWVLCFSLMVQNFFKSSVFPGLAEDVEERSDASKPATSLWLHTLDQILAFDTKMNSLLVQDTGVVQFRSGVDSIIQYGIIEKSKKGLGVVHIFAERPHWLDVWAHVEYSDAWEKLMGVLDTEEAWLVKGSNRTMPEKGIPSGVTAVLAAMWSVIDRCRTLPEVKFRLAFVRKGAIPIAEKYHDELLWRCDQIGGFAGRTTDMDYRKFATCINAARHCEYKLQEWSEDYFFLELRLEDICQNIEYGVEFDLGGEDSKDIGISGLEGTIFDDVIGLYAGFREDRIINLVSVFIGKFERLSKSYGDSMAFWLADGSESIEGIPDRHASQDSSRALVDEKITSVDKPSSVSSAFVEALFMLQQDLKVLSDSLQEEDFTEFCWNLMMKLDEVFVNTLLPSSRRFTRSGTQQLMLDATSLFQVFQPYCVRPAGMFKGLTGAIKEARRTVK